MIKDGKKLKELETTITFEKLYELNDQPVNIKCEKDYLNQLHFILFNQIYPFAGKYRNVNLTKQFGKFLTIENELTIDNYLDGLFEEINMLIDNCQTKYEFSDALARLYTKLIYCHPYREGNGRTIREFLREVSIVKSIDKSFGQVELDFSLINTNELNQYIEVAHI